MEHKLISSLNFLFKLLITCYCILIVKSDAKENNDLIALLALKHSSIDSDPNGFLTGWSPSSSTPCYWHGVSCSGGRVATVNLNGGGLTGRLRLDELMALPGLASLYLSRNSFSGNLSSAGAPPYCRLETLDLSSNNFSEPLSVQTLFQSCDRLRVLNLSRNSIPGGTLKFGPSLAQLDLSRNRISDSSLLSYFLSNCQTLNLLNFSDNKLTGNLGNSTLWSCKSLWTLDLSNNLFSGEIPATLVTGLPESLSVFDLSHNNFTGNLFSLQFESCNNLSILKSQQKMKEFSFFSPNNLSL